MLLLSIFLSFFSFFQFFFFSDPSGRPGGGPTVAFPRPDLGEVGHFGPACWGSWLADLGIGGRRVVLPQMPGGTTRTAGRGSLARSAAWWLPLATCQLPREARAPRACTAWHAVASAIRKSALCCQKGAAPAWANCRCHSDMSDGGVDGH